MFGGGIMPILDGRYVGLQRRKRRVMSRLEVLYEFRRTPHRDIQDVVKHKNLPVNIRACADADYRHIK